MKVQELIQELSSYSSDAVVDIAYGVEGSEGLMVRSHPDDYCSVGYIVLQPSQDPPPPAPSLPPEEQAFQNLWHGGSQVHAKAAWRNLQAPGTAYPERHESERVGEGDSR